MHPIAQYRRVKGWTQADLAQQVGVVWQSAQAWEQGAMPRPKVFRRLAEALEVDPLQLHRELAAWQKEKEPATA